MLINTFLEAHDLLNKAHKTGTYFSYSENRHREICSYEKSATGGLANVRMKLHLKET